ncbi:MAG: RecQ family ATP-dependent DNA helicase [Bacteroidetes bacterium]|nr:RecQ family ATP-dependent DNA helicase [Bacteroidota bacterium]
MRDPLEVLRTTWGYDRFRPMQEEVVRSVLAGRDTLALLPTGSGKSLCFQVPALALGRLCLVVSPLIALMKDQVERLRSLGIRATAITSGMDHAEIDNALENAAVGKTAFLYVSPERLGSELFVARLPRLPLGLIAVDEAHCISQWGYDFRPAYLGIAQLRERHPQVPVLALTASATPDVAQDIQARLGFRAPNLLRGPFQRPELTLWVSRGEDKMGRLLRIAQRTDGSGIVYLRERRGTVRIAQFLLQHGIPAAAYHAGLTFEERDRIQQAWAKGEVRFVAATNAFGMGIDKADVRCVVHLEPPPDLESYYQEAGRGGRDGRPAHAILLTHAGDEAKLRERMQASFPSLADVRRVYQAFADQHGIALGSGQHEAYDLDLRELARRTSLVPALVGHALKALELDGTLALSDGARTPSRVLMRASPSVVYDLRVGDARLGPVLEALLRLYGGLFEEPSIIEEHRIAQRIGWTAARVTATLHELARTQVLFYRPRNDAPMVTLLVPRRDAQRLTLDKEALHDREQRARVRMEAMAAFAFHADACREVLLLRYFGEDAPRDCGRCDVCQGRGIGTAEHVRTAPTPEEIERLRWAIDEGHAAPTTLNGDR